MQYLSIDFWPAGLVLASAALIVMTLRSLERYAHNATVRRTRQALQRALGDDDNGADNGNAAPALRGGADTGVG